MAKSTCCKRILLIKKNYIELFSLIIFLKIDWLMRIAKKVKMIIPIQKEGCIDDSNKDISTRNLHLELLNIYWQGFSHVGPYFIELHLS